MCNKKCGSCEQHIFPEITSVFLILTEKCNLACKYCFVNHNAREMSFETAKDALHFLMENSKKNGQQPSINFFGGEPMMKYADIIKPLIEYSKQVFGEGAVKFSMTTNGTLLTKEILDYLKSNNVGMLLSLDGDKESHDANRIFHDGRGSFDRIDEILDHYLELYPRSVLRCTLERNNVHRMCNSIDYGIEKGFTNFFFVPNSFVEWDEQSKQEIKNQLRLFGDKFIESIRQGNPIVLNPFEEKLKQIQQINKHFLSPMEITAKSKCGLGGNRFASVGTDGTLYGCQEMTSNCGSEDDIFIIGNIYDGTNEEKRRKLFESFNGKEIANLEKCTDCKLKAICDGGCVANNYMQSGRLERQSDIMCFWEQSLLEEAIRVMNVLGEEKNQLFKDLYFTIGGKRYGR